MMALSESSAIAIVCACPSRSGGSFLSSVDFVEAVKQRGRQASLVCLTTAECSSVQQFIEYLGKRHPYTLVARHDLESFIVSGEFGVVIASAAATYDRVHEAAANTAIPFSVIVRGGTYGDGRRFDDRQSAAVRAALRIGCVSVALQRQIRTDFGRDAVVLPTPLPVARSAPAKGRKMVPEIVYVGRFSDRKRADIIPQVVSKMMAMGVPVGAVSLVGEGPSKAPVERALAALGVTLHCEPWVPHARVLELLSKADYLIAPSSREGRPRVALEAIAMGTVPIMSDIPAHREFFAHSAGDYTWPGDDPAAAARLIAQFERRPHTKARFWSALLVQPCEVSGRRFAEAVAAFITPAAAGHRELGAISG